MYAPYLNTHPRYGTRLNALLLRNLNVYKCPSLHARMTALKEENYSDFLRQIRIPSLEQRRLVTDLLYLYKMVNGVFRGNYCPELKLSITRGSETKFVIPGNYGKRRKSSFVVRSCLLWNKLPTEVTRSRTVKEFRSRVFSLELARFVRN